MEKNYTYRSTKKSNIIEFVYKSKLVEEHKNKNYDYSKFIYINNRTAGIIICPIHGEFLQNPHNHLAGYGCTKCGTRSNKEEFIQKANIVYGKDIENYDFSKTIYIDSKKLVTIICIKHNVEFEQTPNRFLQGHGCKICSGNKSNKEEFIKKSNLIEQHKNKNYDYGKFIYIDDSTKGIIICPIHGEFYITPNAHLNGIGCSECSRNKKSNIVEFIKMANLIHDNYFDYSLFIYINARTKGIIICPIHGKFEMTPDLHIRAGCGCRKCNKSKGELKIEQTLKKYDIKYISEKTFENCYDYNKLPFDFYLPKLNICIEYQGKQHYQIIKYFGGEKEFNIRKKHDEIKYLFCIQNNISLIQIPYTKLNNLEKFLLDKINYIIRKTKLSNI